MKIRKIATDFANQHTSDGDARALMIDCSFKNLANIAEPSGSRDSSFGLFHTLGKILYPREGKLEVDPAHLTEPDRSAFHAFLHANYPRHLSSIEVAFCVAESFSWVDAANWRVQQDLFWMPMHTSLPERTIAMTVNRASPKTNKHGFIFLDAPRTAGPRIASTSASESTWI